jgi:uncharacterized membrane protein
MSTDAAKSLGGRPAWPAMSYLVLVGIGCIDAAYLAWGHLSGARLVCLTGSGCDIVAASRYAYLFGVPVAYFGLLLYLAMGLAAWWLSRQPTLATPLAAAVAAGLLGLNVASALFSAYLTWVAATVIDATCNWCLFSAVIMWALLPILFVWIASQHYDTTDTEVSQ